MQHAPARELLHFIKNSPTCYHVTENIRQKLLANGYTELSERERWEVAPGGKYFVRRNGSSTIAFRVPEMIDGGFAMAAAHSDSPAFRLKEHPDRRSAHYVQLSTEKYGGMLMSTWFDRPLSVAGRVFVRANGEIVEKLVSVDRDLLVIPNVAIHMNRTANDGMKYLANIDTLRRIALCLGKDEQELQMMLARSFLVSADNAHAQHPNHGEYADPDNCPYMNEGVVIKFNANQRYATDGRSCAVFRAVCENAGVPTQVMSNRSDLPGGSTLGSISDTLVPVSTVDIGLPQLAMHSSWETAGVQDYEFLIRAMTEYFGSAL